MYSHGVAVDDIFFDVTAPAGGAISTNTSVTMELRDVTLQDNQVVGPFGQGGAMYINEDVMLQTDGVCALHNNAAEFGGAVAMHDARVTLENCSITGNSATQYDGGAIYAVATGNAALRINASTASNNR